MKNGCEAVEGETDGLECLRVGVEGGGFVDGMLQVSSAFGFGKGFEAESQYK